MISYIKNPKDSIKKLLELINEFSKVECNKNPLHVFTNNELSEREIKKTISFTFASKKKI